MTKISFYFDEMMPRKAAEQLTTKSISVVMAVDVGMIDKDDDADHLPYAKSNNLVLVTFDRPFAGRSMKNTDHGGIVCLSVAQNDIGGIVQTLTDFAELYTLEDLAGQVFWI